MNNIYSESDLVSPGVSWGEWKFSLSKEQIYEKVSSFPKLNDDSNKDCEHWQKLFSVLQDKSDLQQSNPVSDVSTVPCEASPMEYSPVLDVGLIVDGLSDNVEDLSVSLVDICNQSAAKLKFSLLEIQEDMKNITNDLNKLNEQSLTIVMDKAWSQLHSEPSKICFCIPFCSNSGMCEKLCRDILLPWMNKSQPRKMEQLSSILCGEGETVCSHLVGPLIQKEGSPLVSDITSLEELMSAMKEKHWTTLLKDFLINARELQGWQIPVLATIVEHAELSCDDLCSLIQLMSSTGAIFAQSREFGALIVSVANCLKSDSASMVSQLRLIANNYKGPLKFKALKILADINC